MEERQKYMVRALELAKLGLGVTSPNPLVGCVIVKAHSIIGEGYHEKYGEAHAEVNAVKSVEDSSLLKDADVYVNLEPCSHFGKTPPCADLLIKCKVGRVFIANEDPNPLVGGMGMQKLRESGIEVISGVCKEPGLQLNRRYFTSITKNRPYIILKWAETSDHFIARKNFDSKWISDQYSRKLVHKWRSEEDAILVGYNTALHDDPRLNVRDWNTQKIQKDPLRIVIDRDLTLPIDHHFLDRTVETIVANAKADKDEGRTKYFKMENVNEIHSLLEYLHESKVYSLIVEGGSKTLQDFIDLNLWDEARIFRSKELFQEGIPAPHISGLTISNNQLINDTLTVIQNSKTNG